MKYYYFECATRSINHNIKQLYKGFQIKFLLIQIIKEQCMKFVQANKLIIIIQVTIKELIGKIIIIIIVITIIIIFKVVHLIL